MFSIDFIILDGIKIATFIAAGFTSWFAFDKTNQAMKLLFLWIIMALVLNILIYVIVFSGKNSFWIFHITTLIEYCIIVYLFSFWQSNLLMTRILRISIFVYALIWIASKLWFEDFLSIDNHTSAISRTLLAVISGYTLFYQVTKNFESIFKDFQFWVSAGILFYCSANLVIFSLAFGTTIWALNNLIIIMTNLFYIRGFRCQVRQ